LLSTPQDQPLVAASGGGGDAETTGGDARRDAAGVYHQAYQFVVLSAANFCPGQPAPGTNETYEAQSPDGQMTGKLSCQ
jgi:hypothetical protein